MRYRRDKIFIDDLEKEIKGRYAVLVRNVEYPQNRMDRIIGEIDLLGINPGYHDYFEVKARRSEMSVLKAINQLLRHRSYFKQNGDSYLFTPKNGIEDLEDIMEEMGVSGMSPRAIEILVRRMKNMRKR